MARASTPTLLALDHWAAILGFNPWQFNQIGKDLPVPITAQCNNVWFQYSWQEDFLSREEIGNAIDSAEQLVADQVKFWPAPKYIEDELIEPRHTRDWGRRSLFAPDGQWKPASTEYMYIRETGKLTRTLLQADAPVVYSAQVGTFEDIFTITITTTTVMNPDEIAIYFTLTDRLGNDIDETWKIRPVKVNVSGTTVTITGSKFLMVKPELEETYAALKLSATLVANFIVEVDVHRVFTDQTATADNPDQGLASWDPPPGCDVDCGVRVAPFCASNDNADSGVVKIQIQAGDAPYPWGPDRLHLNYLSGIPLNNGKMDVMWAKVITYLSVTLLASEKCGCERANRILYHWRSVPSRQDENARPLTISEIDDNPLVSPRRGARYAWNYIKQKVGDSFGY